MLWVLSLFLLSPENQNNLLRHPPEPLFGRWNDKKLAVFYSVKDTRVLVQLNEDISTPGFKTQRSDLLIALVTYFSWSRILHMAQMTSA